MTTTVIQLMDMKYIRYSSINLYRTTFNLVFMPLVRCLY